ncbi:ABC transporter ATP-binding protein [Pseudomonas sp. LRF_L74]|uniref:ABC transporter ATP-binding protein n=1 Tax=Pseudomonas sp. LRF_L74 TaxID=3369422 RepID=UPI003F643E30
MNGVHIEGLRKHFDRQAYKADGNTRGAINGLSLDIQTGEFFVLLGPSGCGKTTTLRCIAGLETPDEGRIGIANELVAAPAQNVLVPPNKRSIGMVFQSYALWPHMSIYDNVGYPLKQRKKRLDKLEADHEIKAALALVGLQGLEGRSPADLSGGQQQRVALARAIVAKPQLLLFDEPLSNLDAQLRLRLRSDLRKVHDQGGHTSIFVTHDQSEALALADRVAVMREGQIEQLGTPEDIFLRPASRFVAEFVGFDNILPGEVIASDSSGVQFHPDGWPEVLFAPASSRLAVGTRAHVALRSANLKILHGSTHEPNTFLANLQAINYLGEYFQGEIVLFGNELLGRFQDHPSTWLGLSAGRVDGLAVQVRLEPSDLVILLDKEQSQSEAVNSEVAA